MAERRFTGRCASPGLAQGVLQAVEVAAVAVRRLGAPAAEAGALKMALRSAGKALLDLMAQGDADAAAIVEFQLAFVEDETLSAPAFAAITSGAWAGEAWKSTLDAEIAFYQGSQDEYFRARAADLVDLRDRVLQTLYGGADVTASPSGGIVLADDLPPSLFLARNWRQGDGIVLRQGSATSHVAILARARGIPMLVGVGDALDLGDVQTPVLLDAKMGLLIIDPQAESQEAFSRRCVEEERSRARAEAAALGECRSKDGQLVEIWLNVADPEELNGISPEVCDGIGLVRSEFFFQRAGLPDEEAQYAFYVRLLDWAAGRPVVVRTFDAGGDKPVPGVTLDGESNPFLGVRGVRLSLLREDVFLVQLRALARAAAQGPLWVMLPMVSVPRELEQTRALLARVVEELHSQGIEARMPSLGMMVEVPAAALTLDRFSADFYSIGSNDLVQYVMAAGRDSPHLADLQDIGDAAVLSLLKQVVDVATRMGRGVSPCGDAAADEAALPLLFNAGLRKLSVAPAALGRVKAAVAELDLRGSVSEGGLK